MIASLFAAAGVGHVSIAQGGDVVLADAVPGGLEPSDEGRRAGLAGPERIRRTAPEVDASLPWRSPSDLTVLAVDGPVRPTVHRTLAADDQVHLVTAVWGAGAVVGPLVVPGRTSCLGCADLHRRDRDPAWPALAAQLTTAPPSPRPSDVSVCVLAAALTVIQGLAYLDGERPATIDGTLETTLPDWRLRRRTWPAHPDCLCAGKGASGHTGLRE